jgi:aspartate/glutamate racemase
MNKRRIGLLGGISHESTAEYYTVLHRKYSIRSTSTPTASSSSR